MSAWPLLQVHGIVKTFPGVRALDGVDFEVRAGEVHVLLGENGAGKSTLMNILSGACTRDAGEIRIDGQAVALASPHEARARGVSTIHQEFTLVPELSVAANIFLGREPTGAGGWVSPRSIERRTAALLQDLGIGLAADCRVAELSVAQQQLVEIARALAFDARVVILDEPTSALAKAEIDVLFRLIRTMCRRGVGMIYISHRMEEIFAIGDRVTVLRDGQSVATREVAGVRVEELIRLMADRELGAQFPRRSVPLGECVLEACGLTTASKLHEVSFTLRRGEILGIAGLLGSGRSSLARVLFGEAPLAAGSVRIRGRDARLGCPRDAIRQGLGYLSEDRKQLGLVLPQSVGRNISLPNVGTTYPRGWWSPVLERRLAAHQVTQLRIKTPGLEQPVVHLSGGNQQKVVLAKWLAREAGILIFDEPTRGIDVGAKADIYELMNQLTERGAAILMISSDLPEVLGMSDRILVLRAGRMAGEFARNAEPAAVLRAALGGDS